MKTITVDAVGYLLDEEQTEYLIEALNESFKVSEDEELEALDVELLFVNYDEDVPYATYEVIVTDGNEDWTITESFPFDPVTGEIDF